MYGLLQRYVLYELLRVFLLSLVVITTILVMVGLIAEASQQGFGPDQILKVLPLLVPGTLPYTVPATTLFAVAVVYGRLSHDNEVTAIKAAGIPISKILWPAWHIALLLSAGVFFLYQDYIPAMHHRLRAATWGDLEELIYTILKRDLCFHRPEVNYSIWVKEVQGRRLIRATFKKRDASGRDEIIAQAREAEIKVDLDEGVVKVLMRHGQMSRDFGATYISIDDEEVIPVPIPPIGAARRIRARELTRAQLYAQIEKVGQQLAQLRDQIAKLAAQQPQGERAQLEQQLEYKNRDYYELVTEAAVRPALAVSTFFYVLVGCPVGIWFHRRDYLSAFVTCFLPIVLTYYPLMMLAINLGKEGRVDPTLTVWLGNGTLGAAGAIMLYLLQRR